MAKTDDMKQINISLSLKQHEDLNLLSNALGNVSKSNLIRIAVAEFIDKNKELIKK